MRDLLYILSIVGWIVVAWITNRLPIWPAPPRTHQQAAAQQQWGCVIGGFLLLFMVGGAAIGYAIPEFINESFGRYHWGFAPQVDALGRLAEVIGIGCGAWVGLRGGGLWLILMVGGYLLSGASHVAHWIVTG